MRFATFAFMAAVALPPLPPAAASGTVPVPDLAWEACPPAPAGNAPTEGFFCATALVPMDHARPGHGSVSLAVIKRPAREPAQRLGTLFWNPGGPSDAGTQYLPAAIGGFPDRVRDRFDIVSWDPRGMGGRSTPVVQCFDSAEAEAAFLDARLQNLAVTPEELAADAAARFALSEACLARNGRLLAHVSTADNARDLDLLRRAVGDERLTYYGTSYGTFLGATYANMFPDRLRAAVLDGAVDPAAWAGNAGQDLTLSTFIRIGSDRGSRATLHAFLDECGKAAPGACAFSAGSPEATRRKWRDLLGRARSGLVLDGQVIDDRAIITYVQSSIYLIDPLPGFGRFPGWAAVGDFLQQAAEAPAAAPDGAPVAAPPAAAPPAAAPYVTSVGRQLAVICGESPNPETAEAASAQALRSYARAGLSAWPFVAACLGWTARAADPYLGPWDRATAGPILVVGNSFDPATPYASSARMARALSRGRLLTVEGFGHTELLNPSRCAQGFIADTLIEGSLPPKGTRCAQDKQPFPPR